MLSDINIGRYYSSSSKIHKMNPISKIIFLIIIILLILLTSDIMLLGPILLILYTMLSASIPYKLYIEILNTIKIPLIILFLIFLIFGLFTSTLLIIKLILIIQTLSILTLTTPTTEIIYGLEKVLYPLNRFKIKSNVIALNIALSLKYIPELIDTKNNILKTQISRGINYKINLKGYIYAMKNMIKPAIKISKRKLKNIKQTMYIKLYTIDKKRTNFRMNKWGIYDTSLITISSILLILILLKGLI